MATSPRRRGVKGSRYDGQAREQKTTKLFVEQSRLGNGRSGGFAAGYAYYAEDGDFCEGGAGDEDAIGVRV
jgi:hypothetical protein